MSKSKEEQLNELLKVDLYFKSRSFDSPSYLFLRQRQIRQKKDEITQDKKESKTKK